jgi:homoserine/homoserine lactone efflux protein
VSLGLARGAAAALRASIGILSANALYFVLSATGIGAMILASWRLFFLVKWIGAAYLVWLGLRMIFSRSAGFAQAAAEDTSSATRPMTSFSHGLLTQGANPKALVFFTALLPQFINPRGPVSFQVAILGVSSILIELMVLSLYAAACDRARTIVQRPGFATTLNRTGGVLLIGAGAGMAAIRRS